MSRSGRSWRKSGPDMRPDFHLWARIALVILVTVAVTPAFADVDQHCLSGCVAGGRSGPECLTTCSYNIAPKPTIIPPVTLESLEAHRTFTTLVPIQTNDIAPKPPQPKVAPEKDLACVSACLRQGLQYDYCNEQCVKTPCPPGVILCKKEQNQFSPNPSP